MSDQVVEKIVKPIVNEEIKPEIEEVEEKQTITEEVDDNVKLFEITHEDYLTDPFFHEVAEYFDLERKEFYDAAPKIATIIEYLVDKFQITDEAGVFKHLSRLERSLPQTVPGQKRYNNIYLYAKLASEKNMHDRKSKAIEGALGEMTNNRA